MIWAFFHAKKHIKPTPMPQLPFKEKAFRVADGMAGLFTIIIILGGIISGIFTATEAGAVASLVRHHPVLRGVPRDQVARACPSILFECCQVNAVVLFLVATSSVFTWILTYENLPKVLANTVFTITDNKFLLLIVINIFLLIVGCLVDLTPAVIMLTPILLAPDAEDGDAHRPLRGHDDHQPLLRPDHAAGGDVALRRPAASPACPMNQIIRPLVPLLAIELVILVAVTYWPPLTMWLPRMFGFVM